MDPSGVYDRLQYLIKDLEKRYCVQDNKEDEDKRLSTNKMKRTEIEDKEIDEDKRLSTNEMERTEIEDKEMEDIIFCGINDMFFVSDILDHRPKHFNYKEECHYKVLWQGYVTPTWEPYENLKYLDKMKEYIKNNNM